MLSMLSFVVGAIVSGRVLSRPFHEFSVVAKCCIIISELEAFSVADFSARCYSEVFPLVFLYA